MDGDPPTLPGMEAFAPVAVVHDDASPTARRTARRRNMLAAGVHPATGLKLFPAVFGHKCGGCAHAVQVQHGNQTYWKCDTSRLGLSRSAASAFIASIEGGRHFSGSGSFWCRESVRSYPNPATDDSPNRARCGCSSQQYPGNCGSTASDAS